MAGFAKPLAILRAPRKADVTGPSERKRAAGVGSRRVNIGPSGSATNRPAAAKAAENSKIAHNSHAHATDSKGKYKPSNRTRRNPQLVYGALDLGTNNCRLLVARPTRRSFLVIDAFSRIIRLGEGVGSSGMLTEEAMSRTIEALKVCSHKMKRRGVSRSRLIATEACRIATNGVEFIDRVQRDTGLTLEVVTRETEAKLAVSGCASLLDKNCERAMVFDIGGGSSELIWLDLTRRKKRWRRSLYDRLEAQNCIVAWTSIPIGVVTLAEQFGGRHVDSKIFEMMVESVVSPLKDFETQYRIGEYLENGRAHLMGTSGTVTTVAGVHLGLPYYDRRRVDGCWLTSDDVRNVSGSLLNMSYEQRVAQPCIGLDRADLVLAGCAILEALLRMWPCERLRVADRGLREGILATLMAEDGHLRGTDPQYADPSIRSL